MVTSKPMPDQKPTKSIEQQIKEAEAKAATPTESSAPVAPVSSRSRLVGLFALIIGTPFWLEAARFTRDGWIAFLNWMCDRMGIPWQVPALDWRLSIGLMVAIGLAYSYIEIGRQPIRMPRKWGDILEFRLWRFERKWEVWAVWFVLIISDVGTTYLGARKPDPSGLAIMTQIASDGRVLALYAILLTFLPDRLCKFGWHSIKGK